MLTINGKGEVMQYLTKRLGSSDDPSIKFPLRQLSKRSEKPCARPQLERTVAVYVPGRNLDASNARNLVLSM